MLKRSDIKGMAGNLTYGRGIELYQKRKVLQYHVETDMLDPDLENVIAKVKGSGRSAYTVETASTALRCFSNIWSTSRSREKAIKRQL